MFGQISPEEIDKGDSKSRERVFEIYSSKMVPAYLFLAKAILCKLEPDTVVKEISNHTNLCMAHFAGCCPHVECTYSHEEKAGGLLLKYIQAVNDRLPVSCKHQIPANLRVFERARDLMFKLFKHHTTRGQFDPHKLLRAHLLGWGKTDMGDQSYETHQTVLAGPGGFPK